MRYYKNAEAPGAQRIVNIMENAGVQARSVDLNLENNTRVRRNHFEVLVPRQRAPVQAPPIAPPPPPSASMPDAYAALRHPFVRRFALGRFAAIAGWQMINVAVGWLLYERTHDAWSLGLVGVAELAPVLLLMVLAGHAADRYPRRNVGIFAHALVASAAIGLALLSWLEGPTLAIYSLLALIGTARAFASPSVNTILPQSLAPAEFANANAWLSSTFQLAAISGPAMGGLAIAATGSATASFAFAALGQVIFMAMLTTLPAKRPAGDSHSPRARMCSRAFASSATIRSFSPPSRSTFLACCSAAPSRCCRSSPRTSWRSGPRDSDGSAPRQASAR